MDLYILAMMFVDNKFRWVYLRAQGWTSRNIVRNFG
jgi:hypothetical protein